jgi:hypothetical protein
MPETESEHLEAMKESTLSLTFECLPRKSDHSTFGALRHRFEDGNPIPFTGHTTSSASRVDTNDTTQHPATMEDATLAKDKYEGKVGDVNIRWGPTARKRLEGIDDEGERTVQKALAEKAVSISAGRLHQEKAKIL